MASGLNSITGARPLDAPVGSMTYDKLIAGMTPATKVASGTVRKLAAAATYARGTVLARSSGTAGDNKLVILGTAPVTNEVLTPDCVLCDDTDIGAADENAAVYVAGCFNYDALSVKSGYTITQADIDKLRERGIYLGELLD